MRTKLDGLLTQLNIQYSNLNKLQIKKAKYGLDIPLYLENSIDDLQAEIDQTEAEINNTRVRLKGMSLPG